MKELKKVKKEAYANLKGYWCLHQVWSNILLVHFPVPKSIIRPLIPRCCQLDTFDNTVWISVVPLRIGVKGFAKIPFIRSIPEVNVRTYIKYG
ncbi:uncharacterized protein YqjF (DUF2071 family) [Evansella vedderi]|uniref:Uncharacterized protein YqjF (DUF2071 family) n=1 Tax=Evansella vedderi TaxID=38282 RepID=A0ABT9ZU00_9BACI|nr:DUF2071 domain-containing protein [Evansella vedderi]MDQ0254714.1 uncharacterized protein YqjF (DUF2071 family) [Evansella vedderi]